MIHQYTSHCFFIINDKNLSINHQYSSVVADRSMRPAALLDVQRCSTAHTRRCAAGVPLRPRVERPWYPAETPEVRIIDRKMCFMRHPKSATGVRRENYRLCTKAAAPERISTPSSAQGASLYPIVLRGGSKSKCPLV